MEHVYDMIIVGGGPGGYTAALYGTRAGLDTLIVERLAAGGQMAQTSQIDNYPGFAEGVDGFYLADQMQKGAERFGAKTVYAEVETLRLEEDIKQVHTSDGVFYGRTVVMATGANPRPLGVAHEQELTGRGIHYCAACDGMFYRGKTVMVVGGGNTAAADAMLLSRVAKKVILVHRRDTLRATRIYHEPLERADNVELMWNSVVTELVYDQFLNAVKVKNVLSGEVQEVPVDGVFVSVGRIPVTDLVKDTLQLDAGGYIVADETTKTNIPGVFAVGDVRTKALRQVVTAVSDGAVASFYAEEFLTERA